MTETRLVSLLVGAALVLAAAHGHAQTGPASLQAFRSDSELRNFLHPEVAPPGVPASPVAPAQPAACPAAAEAPPAPPVSPPVGPAAVITGRVTGACGEPEPFVLVRVESLNAGTSTRADGSFRLVIPGSLITDGQSVRVSASGRGLTTRILLVTVTPGAATVQDFQVRPAPVIMEDVLPSERARMASMAGTPQAGVNEGGTVKVHGGHLVMLRRNRLFTVAIGGGRLAPVDAVDVYGPDADPDAVAYEEMLVSGDQVVVLGQGGGTEVALFRIGPAGRLTRRAAYHFRSNDGGSGQYHTSRLVGSRLVIYEQVVVGDGRDLDRWMPAMRRLRRGAREEDFRRMLPARHVYRPAGLAAGHARVLHTLTTCDLAAAELRCESRAVLGAWGRELYVSPTSVYVWTGPRDDMDRVLGPITLYRMPLQGGRPSAVGVEGLPVDRFSFLETAGHLNVVVHDAAPRGAGPVSGSLRLLRLPLGDWGDGSRRAPPTRYRALPGSTNGYSLRSRFVCGHLLYGGESGCYQPMAGATLFAVRLADGFTSEMRLPHGVHRIVEMGRHAVVVGAGLDGLHLSRVRLGRRPRVTRRFARPDDSLRRYGVYYRGDAPHSGSIGLSIRRPSPPGYVLHGSASVLFVRDHDGHFTPMGELEPRGDAVPDDECVASCEDWYDNARPLFLHGRVFALMGHEIVEGVISGGRIRESRRVSFAPPATRASPR